MTVLLSEFCWYGCVLSFFVFLSAFLSVLWSPPPAILSAQSGPSTLALQSSPPGHQSGYFSCGYKNNGGIAIARQIILSHLLNIWMTPQRRYGDSCCCFFFLLFYLGVHHVTIIFIHWVVLNWPVYSQFQRLTHNQ